MPRTRAMGESPNGFLSLGMDAPTRRRRAAQPQGSQRRTRRARGTAAVRDTSDQATSSYVSSPSKLNNTFDIVIEEHESPVVFEEPPSSLSNRKTADTLDEQRSANRTRVGEIAAEDKLVPEPQPETSAKSLENTSDMMSHSPPTNTLNQNNLPESSNDPAGVQPTSVLCRKTLTEEELLENQQSQQTFHNVRRLDPAVRPIYEESLSDCEEDQWFCQLQRRMIEISIPSLPPDPNVVNWDRDSKAMFLARTDESRGNPSMRLNLSRPPPSQVTTRSLTQDSVIAAVSAGLDWFENNPGGAVPTAEEMSSLLANFNRSKEVNVADKQCQTKKSPHTTPYVQRAQTTRPIASTNASPPKTSPSTPEHSMVQAPSPHLPSSQVAESRSWASALSASATNFIRSPFSIFRSPNRRQVRLEKNTQSVNSSLGIAPLGEATRSGKPRRTSNPADRRALREAETELEGRLALERSSREAETSRAAQRARARMEAGAVEDRVERKTPATSTPTFSNTFSYPEYSDSDSDEDEEDLPGLTRCSAQPLWIPRGYKALAAGGQCDAGTEFDLPKWVKIRNPEEAARLAEAWNDRVLGSDHRTTDDLRALPTVRLGVPPVLDSWLSQDEMADRFACQQEFEKLDSMRSRTDDPESLAELDRRKAEQAEESVRQRKKGDKLDEAGARPRADGDAGPPSPSPNTLLESSENRINRSLLKARAEAEKHKPKVPSGLRVGKNMSPIQDTSQGVINDADVINSMMGIPEEDIVAEEFPGEWSVSALRSQLDSQ